MFKIKADNQTEIGLNPTLGQNLKNGMIWNAVTITILNIYYFGWDRADIAVSDQLRQQSYPALWARAAPLQGEAARRLLQALARLGGKRRGRWRRRRRPRHPV
jgi:hypothetical protein